MPRPSNYVDEPPPCENHKEIQHRDGKPPWCNACGWSHGRPAIEARQLGSPRLKGTIGDAPLTHNPLMGIGQKPLKASDFTG